MPLYSLVRRRFFLMLVVVLAGNLLAIRIMSKDKDSLKNRHSPQGIISLELATSNDRQQSIIQAWENTPVNETDYTALQVAKRQTEWDYLFIFFYTLLFCLLLVRLSPAKQREAWIKASLTLALAAGLLDCVENIFMLQAMNGRNVSPWKIWLPSGAKWLIVLGMSSVILIRSMAALYFALRKTEQSRK